MRKVVVACFLSLAIGALCGNISDDLNQKVFVAQHVDPALERACLREALYYEGRSGLIGEQKMQGMIILARVKDPDKQWPKTICGVVHQKGQFSYWGDKKLLEEPIDAEAWKRADSIAKTLIAEAWRKQLLPHGAGCVRHYKLRDTRLASLSPLALVQLHVSPKSLGFFARTQALVFSLGNHSFYQNKNGCTHQLPTT